MGRGIFLLFYLKYYQNSLEFIIDILLKNGYLNLIFEIINKRLKFLFHYKENKNAYSKLLRFPILRISRYMCVCFF